VRSGLALLCLLLARAPVVAQELSYREAYESLRDAAYDQSEPIEQTRGRYRGALRAAGADAPDERLRLYRLSRVEYMAGRAEQAAGSLEAATRHYEASLAHARDSLDLGPYSEGYRMMAEAVSQMCLTRGPAFLLASGSSVLRYARQAIALDERNGRAHIILAASRVYPPAAFGGDPRQGVGILKRCMEMPDIEKDDWFNIYSGMGVGCRKLHRQDEAALWLDRARGLYPGNRFARREHDRLR